MLVTDPSERPPTEPAGEPATGPPGEVDSCEGTADPVLACEIASPEPGATADATIEEELAEARRLAAERTESLKSAVRDRELLGALAGQPLLPGAAEQLLKLWREELDAYEEQGVVRVATRDGRTAAAAVAEWLARPEFAHFCQPPSRGGAGAGGVLRPIPPPPAPRNLGEAVIQQWREAAVRGFPGHPPIGLNRRCR